MEFNSEKTFKKYSGIIPCQVLIINPSLAEAEKLGIKMITKEPSYTGIDFDGVDHTSINIFLKYIIEGTSYITNVNFYVNKNEKKPSQAENLRFINNKLKWAWAKSKEEVLAANANKSEDWMKVEDDGLRIAKVGEEELLQFIKAWGAIGGNNDIKFKDFDKIAGGDITELREIHNKEIPNNFVKCLIGINDKGYAVVYKKWFGSFKSSLTPKTKDLESSPFKADYQNSFKLLEYSGSPQLEMSTAQPTDDLPF